MQLLMPPDRQWHDVDVGVRHRLRLSWQAACLSLGIAGCSVPPSAQVIGGDASRGQAAIARYGCTGCHTIPGIAGHASDVGPPLATIGRRTYLGGVLANTPENMVRWLHNAPGIDPRTAMPDMGIGDADARDIAAYLYTLE